MPKILLALLFLFLGASSSLAQQPDLLQADEAFQFSAEREESGGMIFRWTIAEGYYLYRSQLQARDAAAGREIELRTRPGTVEDDPNFGPSEVYYGEALASLDREVSGTVTLSYQGCKKDSICYPPVTRTIDTQTLEVSEASVGFGLDGAASAVEEDKPSSPGFEIAKDAGGGLIQSLLASGGALWVIASFLAFGLLLAFTPCVLPMYPILSATLAREGEALTAKRGFVLSLAYVLAMATAFGLLGIVAAWSGQNLQMVLQSPYAVGAVAVLFVVLAASMFGMFELQLPSAWVNRVAGTQYGRRGSLGGAAAIGFTSALIVGPCVTAPLAAALLYIAQTGDARLGAAALFALGLGQGIPLIAFGTLGSRALPRAGAWMEHVKRVFGFVFLAAAVWMAGRILPGPAELMLWAVLLIGAAVFIGAFDGITRDATVAMRFRKTIGVALSMMALVLAIGAASGGSDPLRPLAHLMARAGPATRADALVFASASSAQDLQATLARSQGRPSLVYFTADWCVTCKTVERNVLPAPDVVAGLRDFQLVEVDLSTLDEQNQALMRDLAVVGPPTMIFFDADRSEIAGSRLVGDVTADSLLASAALVER